MAKFIVLVKATMGAEAGEPPSESMLGEMGVFHEELRKAGVLVDYAGLKRSAEGWRIEYGKGGKRSFVDGPFTETKELIAGYTIIDVESREEAIAWTRRYPNPSNDDGEAAIEVRPFFAPEELAAVRKARGLRLQRS